MAETKKNYQYLALQLRQRLLKAQARQAQFGFNALSRNAFPEPGASDEEEEEHEGRNDLLYGGIESIAPAKHEQELGTAFLGELGPAALLSGQWQVGGSSSSRARAPAVAQQEEQQDFGFDRDAWEMGFQVLADLAAARTRVGLRTWGTYARRAKLQDLNSTVMQVLRIGQARPGMDTAESERHEASRGTARRTGPPTPSSLHSSSLFASTGRPHPGRLGSATNLGSEAVRGPPSTSAASTPLAFVHPQNSPGSAASHDNRTASSHRGPQTTPTGATRFEGLAEVITQEVLNPSVFPNSPSAVSAVSLMGAHAGASSPSRANGQQPAEVPSVGSLAQLALEGQSAPGNRLHAEGPSHQDLPALGAAAAVEAGAGPAPPARSRIELLEERLQALQQELAAERQSQLAPASAPASTPEGLSLGVSAAPDAVAAPASADMAAAVEALVEAVGAETGVGTGTGSGAGVGLGEAGSAAVGSSVGAPAGGAPPERAGSVLSSEALPMSEVAAATFAESGVEAFGRGVAAPTAGQQREGSHTTAMAARAAVEEVLWGAQSAPAAASLPAGNGLRLELEGGNTSRRLGDFRRAPGPQAQQHELGIGAIFQPHQQHYHQQPLQPQHHHHQDAAVTNAEVDAEANNSNNSNNNTPASGRENMDDFVKELRGDQTKVDEVVQLANLLWDTGLLKGKPTLPDRVKACLLLRLAQRLEEGLKRESLQQWWNGSAVRRSLEELWARNPAQAARLASQAQSQAQQTSPPLQGSHPVTPSAIAFGLDSVSPPQTQRSWLGRPGPWHGGRNLDLNSSPQRSARLRSALAASGGVSRGTHPDASGPSTYDETNSHGVLVLGDSVDLFDAAAPTRGGDARFASALGREAGNPSLPRPTVNERLQDVQADASEERVHLERELAAVQQQQEESTAAALALKESEARARTSESAAMEEITHLRAQLFRAEALVAEASSDSQHADEQVRLQASRSMAVIQDAAATPGGNTATSSSRALRGARAEPALERLALVGRDQASEEEEARNDKADAAGVVEGKGEGEQQSEGDEDRSEKSQAPQASQASLRSQQGAAAEAEASTLVEPTLEARTRDQLQPPKLDLDNSQRLMQSPGTPPDESDDDDDDSLPLDFDDEGPPLPLKSQAGVRRPSQDSTKALPAPAPAPAASFPASTMAGAVEGGQVHEAIHSSREAHVGGGSGAFGGPGSSASVAREALAPAPSASPASPAVPATQAVAPSKPDISDVLGILSDPTDDEDDDGASIDDDDLANLLA